jgi:hypothetical protein
VKDNLEENASKDLSKLGSSIILNAFINLYAYDEILTHYICYYVYFIHPWNGGYNIDRFD